MKFVMNLSNNEIESLYYITHMFFETHIESKEAYEKDLKLAKRILNSLDKGCGKHLSEVKQ